MWVLFEGPEATGKSTQAEKLRDHLVDLGHEVLLTKEPGSPHDEVCKKIRSLLLDPEHDISQETALFLFIADRSQHMRKVVLPALEEGKVVISDRSSLSTLFYYLAERDGYDEDYVEHCESDGMLFKALALAQDYRKADLCLIAKATHNWAEKAMVDRGALDRIEQKGGSLHSNIHKYFDSVANTRELHDFSFFPKRVVDLPAIPDSSAEEVSSFALQEVLKHLN